ncbi:hypothetical protein ACOME3_005963 [Neoechinorhynchus agilis]
MFTPTDECGKDGTSICFRLLDNHFRKGMITCTKFYCRNADEDPTANSDPQMARQLEKYKRARNASIVFAILSVFGLIGTVLTFKRAKINSVNVRTNNRNIAS